MLRKLIFKFQEFQKQHCMEKIKQFSGVIGHHIDRLFFHAALDVMRRADVYNPGARNKVPKFYLIDSLIPSQTLRRVK